MSDLHEWVRLAVGQCGSGKTHTFAALLARGLRTSGWKFVGLDPNAELSRHRALGGAPRLRVAVARTTTQASALVDAGERCVFVQPGIMVSDDGVRTLANDLCRIACERRGVVVVLPEIHRVAEEGKPLPPYVGELVHRFRHFKSGLWGDTQHFADLKKEVFREARWLYLHANTAHEDRVRIAKHLGPQVLNASTECARRLRAGQPGWHVVVDMWDLGRTHPLRRL